MEEKQETSADIVAEIRARAKAWPEPSLVQYDERLADRLEAALKREKAEIEAEALAAGGIVEAERHKPGNAAALREALLKAIVLLKACEWPDDTPMQDVAEVIDEIEKASSAPPRNCDKFNCGDPTKDAADAYDEWQRHCDDPLMPPSCKVESAFKQWLFATAKPEAKGETDGSK